MDTVISIIVPSFNEEKNISRCLDSILSQTFTDFEVICVDDNSTDSTVQIIEKYILRDSRIKLFKNTGKGVSSARNYGIDKSNGKYISFVDSDDFIQPQMLEFLYKAISENDGDMSVCDCNITNEINIINNFSYNFIECTCEYLLNDNKQTSLISMNPKLIKKELLNLHSFSNNLRIGEDLVLSSELWNASNKVFFCDIPLYYYCINSNSVTHTDYSNIKWLDRPKAHYIAYKNFLNYKEKNISVWFLESGMKHLLTFLFYSNGKNKNEIKSVYKEFSNSFYSCKNISFVNKIYVFISYHCPQVYRIRRKLLDKTLR